MLVDTLEHYGRHRVSLVHHTETFGTWQRLQDIQSQVHRAQRCIVKKKRARAFVQEAQEAAKKKGLLARKRKLRTVRKTRFNSRVQVLDAFLANVAVMRKVLKSTVFQECIKASKEAVQKKLEMALKSWTSDAVYFRARRALLISGPVASLCRKVAGDDFFLAFPVWMEARKEVEKAVAEQDFVDSAKREDGATLTARMEKVKAILTKRGAAFSTSVHQAAWVLDPRVVDLYLSPEGSQVHAEARQAAIRETMYEFVPRFWPMQEYPVFFQLTCPIAFSNPEKKDPWVS